ADFVGNPTGSEITNTGYGAYWTPISRAATHFGAPVDWAGEGLSPNDVYNAVLDGKPVIFWVPYDWDTPARHDYVAFDGRTIPYAGPEEHTMVVTGVTPTEVRVNDPDRGQYWVPKAQFEANYRVYNEMVVVIRP
ncbi:MAG: C39 family peptidase, partial [Candidatus Dormiibacterota bacterium]